MADVWIYKASDKYSELGLLNAAAVSRVQQLKGDWAPPVIVHGPDVEMRVADPVKVIGEPPLPDHFGLWLVQALEEARLEAAKDDRDRAVTARLTAGQTWSWEIYRLDALPLGWRPPAGS